MIIIIKAILYYIHFCYMSESTVYIAEFFLRVFAGVLFLFQGYDKLFRIRIKGVIGAFQSEAAVYQIPKWLLSFVAYYTSLVEFIGGILLILGLCSNYALIAIGVDLILVSIAFSFIEPMWDTKHVFPRFILIILLLILPAENSKLCLDHLFCK